MSKQQMQVAVIIVCLVIIAGVLGKQVLGKKKNSKNQAVQTSSSTVSPAQEAISYAQIKFDMPALSQEMLCKQALGVQAPWGRNPFMLKTRTMKPEAQHVSPLTGISISAIIMRGDVGMAMVNQEIVHQGENWRGYKVVKIDISGVVLEREGQQVIIPYAK